MKTCRLCNKGLPEFEQERGVTVCESCDKMPPPRWDVIGFAVKNGYKYLIVKCLDHANPLYNIIKEGAPMPTGGYFDLAAVMRLKGINGFQSGGAR